MSPLLFVAVALSLPGVQAELSERTAAACPVQGLDVSVAALENGAQAFGNRDYVWTGVPEAIQGWQFTRIGGGKPAFLRIAAGYKGPVHLATAADAATMKREGWQPVENLSFHYTDAAQTEVAVYRTEADGSSPLLIPQRGWTGGILLAQRIEVQQGTPEPDLSQVPGVVIDYSPAYTGLYIGSPSLAVLPDGTYVASHDWFGPGSTEHQKAVTHVLASTDRGQTWHHRANIDGQFWSNLFVHGDDLYILGTYAHYGNLVIRRSTDGGVTWTEPSDAASGLLREGRYHCAPMPVITHEGRLWRGFEDTTNRLVWGKSFRAMMFSAPVEADLLKAESWTLSEPLPGDTGWLDGGFGGWLEGNAVVTPEGGIVDILRVDTPASQQQERAAIVAMGPDGKRAAFDPATDFIVMPGGAKKFVIRPDPESNRYWALGTPAAPALRGTSKPAGVRNTLALLSSTDLKDWRIDCVLLHHPDVKNHGFQYPDWLFDGDDIIAVVRTAYTDGLGGAHNNHDANFMTFHRIPNFRSLTPADSVVEPESSGFSEGVLQGR